MEGAKEAALKLRTESAGGESEDFALMSEEMTFRTQARFSEARETLERLKTLLETRGNQLSANTRQFELCSLLCDEGRPREGLECLARHPRSTEMGSKSSWVNLIEAKCRYLASDFQGAEEAAAAARADTEEWGYYADRVLANLYLLRARAAQRNPTQAIPSLRAELAETERNGAKALGFEVSLALGEVELRAGRPEGRSRLVKLEQEATSREFFRIARLAREALDQHPARPGSRPPR